MATNGAIAPREPGHLKAATARRLFRSPDAHPPDLDPGLFADVDPSGDSFRSLEVLAIDYEESSECLLGLGVRSVECLPAAKPQLICWRISIQSFLFTGMRAAMALASSASLHSTT
jgi:hypothetical protein